MYEDFTFKYYFVQFLDILGQREALRNIKALPTEKDDIPQFASLINDSYGKVSFIRKSFQEFYEIERNKQLPKSAFPPGQYEIYIDAHKFEVLYYGISDSMIIAIPISNKYEHCTAIAGIYNTLVASCHVFLVSLVNGIIVRAGLDIGIAAQIEERELYGPAFERAYFLESSVADYPRMVIGTELFRYFDFVDSLQCQTQIGKMGQLTAKQCRELIIKDTDNQYMLDFLGSKMHSYVKSIVTKEHFIRAMSFVQEQCNKYSAVNNVKLKSRHERLLNYFKLRQDIWLS